MSLDIFLHKIYNRRTYNCAHLVTDIWKHLTGVDLTEDFGGFLLPPSERYTPEKLRNKFIKLAKPISPCIVIMRRPRQAPHVGVYYKRRIIHITERGVQNVPPEVATFGFKSIRYYSC